MAKSSTSLSVTLILPSTSVKGHEDLDIFGISFSLSLKDSFDLHSAAVTKGLLKRYQIHPSV